ncbi:50S ribosomal protein L18 [Caldisalinibacter kiritimatiensis]|uniref:Large ribosomal subunit protein uL18 n=1 Tax=Caldisalinibacter kiritimatiensis TaxID=1304284 RepID=R1CQS6_9FIRM|nr:50S ribosomal protein L18 [Caldisalinibacter kiritimatiensis]EOD01006.1 LSU ribosomal protein L18p (L5e) [Caldisalinibacter kiritimatiensis]
MIKKVDKNKKRVQRHRKIRKKIYGTPERPRFNVFRSLNHIYAQIIDDVSGHTLVAASTLDKDIKEKADSLTKKEAAKLVGETVAKRALEKGIESVVFDRGGYIYHGRVKELAEGAREGGLKF